MSTMIPNTTDPRIDKRTIKVGGDEITLMVRMPTFEAMTAAHLDPAALGDRMKDALGRVEDWVDVVDAKGDRLPYSLPLLQRYLADRPGMFRAFHEAAENDYYGRPPVGKPKTASGPSSEATEPTT